MDYDQTGYYEQMIFNHIIENTQIFVKTCFSAKL